MKIKPFKVTIKELAKGYVDNGEDGVIGFNGKLDIRPPYQREFIYGEKDTKAVIHTILNGFPLNVMYLTMNFLFIFVVVLINKNLNGLRQ